MRSSTFYILFTYTEIYINTFLYAIWSVKKTEITALEIRCADHATFCICKKLALSSPTSSGRSIGVVSLRISATELCFVCHLEVGMEYLRGFLDYSAIFSSFVAYIVIPLYSSCWLQILYKFGVL
jgi:hypothetical protein